MADAGKQGRLPGSPGGGSHESGGDLSPRSNLREQDRFLPIANISRIMKKALPANGKIAKDAKETVQECVSEFISFITSEASDKCQREKRKTINGDDLLWAMVTLGFEDYIDPLKVYLARYREMEGDTKASAKGADGSSRNEAVQPSTSSQLAYQGSFSQVINYGNSQVPTIYVSLRDSIFPDNWVCSHHQSLIICILYVSLILFLLYVLHINFYLMILYPVLSLFNSMSVKLGPRDI